VDKIVQLGRGQQCRLVQLVLGSGRSKAAETAVVVIGINGHATAVTVTAANFQHHQVQVAGILAAIVALFIVGQCLVQIAHPVLYFAVGATVPAINEKKIQN